MSGEQTTISYSNSSTETREGKNWDLHLLIFDAISVLQLVIVVWLTGCVIIYGTKTGRWRKNARASSLNSGMVYTTCAVAIVLYLPKVISTILLQIVAKQEKSNAACELLCDLDNAAYTLSTYMAYFFLWLRQRIIFRHPYVKDKISAIVNWFSRLFVIILTLVAIALCLAFTVPESYAWSGSFCVIKPNPGKSTIIRNIALAGALILSQFIILGLAIYPAVKVKFASNDDVTSTESELGHNDATEGENIRNSEKSCVTSCLSVIGLSSHGSSSPIELSVRRMVACSIIMVCFGIICIATANLTFPAGAPLVLSQTIYDLSGFVNVFCMLGTFAFSGKVVTLCCPTCKAIKRRRTRSRSMMTIDEQI